MKKVFVLTALSLAFCAVHQASGNPGKLSQSLMRALEVYLSEESSNLDRSGAASTILHIVSSSQAQTISPELKSEYDNLDQDMLIYWAEQEGYKPLTSDGQNSDSDDDNSEW